jgi:hypothetical protein
MRRIKAGGSVLDLVLDKAVKASRRARRAPRTDRARLDQYFHKRAGARAAARPFRLAHGSTSSEAFGGAIPSRKTSPMPIEVIAKSKLMFDLVPGWLFETDSTRAGHAVDRHLLGRAARCRA